MPKCAKYFVIVALALFATAAQAASKLKPGEYAQNSKIYMEVLLACQRPFDQRVDSDSPRALALDDQAARRMESLYKNNRKQYDLNLEGCRRSLPTSVQTQAVKRVPAPAATDKVRLAGGAEPEGQSTEGRKPEGQKFSSFDNVAAESLKVTSQGRDYDLRRLRGPTKCDAPKTWQRTEQCFAIDKGGVSCKMECR